MNMEWHSQSWKEFPISQQPVYKNKKRLREVIVELSNVAPIVYSCEVDKLRKELADVCLSGGFVLHVGDCAESFDDASYKDTEDYLSLISSMKQVLDQNIDNVVCIGRVAGQLAKPRSSCEEVVNGVTLPSYQGDMVNSVEFAVEARDPDPENLLKAYRYSIKKINEMRSLACVSKSYVYTSHEALILDYEGAFTKCKEFGCYNLSAHFLWIGNRTRSIGEAHIEYIRGINNPVAIKVDSCIEAQELKKLINIVNPNNVPGKIIVICRFGADSIQKKLPLLLDEMLSSGLSVIWSCDPMHGNTTYSMKYKKKMRNLKDIASELCSFFDILEKKGVNSQGMHLEITSQDVVECIDSARDFADFGVKYNTRCDPRLNGGQSLALINLVNELLGDRVYA